MEAELEEVRHCKVKAVGTSNSRDLNQFHQAQEGSHPLELLSIQVATLVRLLGFRIRALASQRWDSDRALVKNSNLNNGAMEEVAFLWHLRRLLTRKARLTTCQRHLCDDRFQLQTNKQGLVGLSNLRG